MSSTPPPFAIQLLAWPPLTADARRLLVDACLGPFVIVEAIDATGALEQLRGDGIDLAIVSAELLPDPAALRQLAERLAVVLQTDVIGDATAMPSWIAALEQGVQDVLVPSDWAAPATGLRLRAAVLRQRRARQARTAYATDLATGLPHQQQLLEHMNHLLALREREPAPMALLVLRIEGLATTEARLGAEAASALRRKLAVRLRSGLRASDVVASIGSDSFAVLLAWIDAAADVGGVADKLVRSVQRPFTLAGQPVALAVSVGIGHFPEDGKDADTLLRGAAAQAAAQPGQGRAGFVNHLERGPATAANDD